MSHCFITDMLRCVYVCVCACVCTDKTIHWQGKKTMLCTHSQQMSKVVKKCFLTPSMKWYMKYSRKERRFFQIVAAHQNQCTLHLTMCNLSLNNCSCFGSIEKTKPKASLKTHCGLDLVQGFHPPDFKCSLKYNCNIQSQLAGKACVWKKKKSFFF